jgi:uncharacterized protein YegP (UPF0339 family)
MDDAAYQPRDERAKGKKDRWRGVRHLRVGILMQGRNIRVDSIWVVDQPAIQAATLVEPILARVDVAGRLVLVQAIADPRITRGTFRKELGHHYGVADSGTFYVSAPFSDVRDLSEIRIRVIDASRSRGSATDPDSVAALFDRTPDSMSIIADIGATVLQTHRDWTKVATELALPTEVGRFEIYIDSSRAFRWRLKRSGYGIVGESAHAHPTREACEEEIRWIRAQAESLSVVPLDVPGGGCAD